MAENNIDKWLLELEFARNELLEKVKTTSRTDGIMTAILAAGIGVLGFVDINYDLSNVLMVLFGATVISILLDYLLVLNWCYIYDMNQLAARVMAIEKIINEKLNETIFIWESSIGIKLNTLCDTKKITGVKQPNRVRGYIVILLYIFLQAWIVYFVIQAGNIKGNTATNETGVLNLIWGIVLGVLNLTFIIIVIIQWAKTMNVSFRKHIERIIFEEYKGK